MSDEHPTDPVGLPGARPSSTPSTQIDDLLLEQQALDRKLNAPELE